MHQLRVTANVVPSSPILVTIMMEALSSFETLVFTIARHNIQEDAILHETIQFTKINPEKCCKEKNLKIYVQLNCTIRHINYVL
jgi:hypothetical protein